MLKSSLKRVQKQVKSWLGAPAAKDGSVGAIDALDGYVLRGWFISRGPNAQGNRFGAFVDDHSLGTFEARLPRPDVAAAEGVLECGFAVNVEPALRSLPGGPVTASDVTPRRFTLRTLQGRVVAEKTITPAENDTSSGVIDGLDGFVLRGWFISRHPQVTSNRFEVALDGSSLGSFDAIAPRPDLLAAEGVLNCGFAIDLEPALRALPRGVYSLNDGEPHRFALMSVGKRVVAERVLRGASPFRGFFDELTPTGVSGWAVDESRPDTPVDVSVFLDGAHFLDIETSQLRRDLIAEEIPGQVAGFQLTWPRGLLRPGTVVDIRYKKTGDALVDSPRTIGEEGESWARTHLGFLDAARLGELRAITVVVPVHDAFEAVSECLESVERLTGCDAKVLVVDDGSTDPRVAELLSEYETHPRFRIVRHAKALGYTRTINEAIRACEPDDVVLLNSDTVVTERWLESLRYGAYAWPRVATVTALSDNAGAFSCPEIGVANPVPPHLTAERYARIVTNQSDGRLPEVPTGNGFCMYLTRKALDAIGLFDEQKFPRGYGEENDFCMRALRRGWKNLISDKAYVLHKRSQSFQGDRQPLAEAGAAQIQADYPEYKLLIGRFNDAELGYIRLRARAALMADSPDAALPRILFVVSTKTGGMPQTNLDLMHSLRGRYHGLLLRSDAEVVTLSELVGDELVVRETHPLSEPIDPVTHRSDEYDHLVLDLMYRYSVALLHIRHVAWHSLGIAEAAKFLGIPVVYSSHDFYAVCPSLNLLDEDIRYCAGHCTPGDGTCLVVLWPPSRLPSLKHRFVHRWRDMFHELFAACDALVLSTQSAADILLGFFPEAREKTSIIAHGRDFRELRSAVRHPTPDGTIRVIVPGNISPSKGAHLLRAIHEVDEDKRLEFHFLGNVIGSLGTFGARHGTYDRAQFASKVDAIGPHVGVILSVCPETYCHTLTELWASGVPVVAIDLGAVGERIRKTGGGWLVPPDASPTEVRDAIIAAVDDAESFDQRLREVRAWQLSEGRWNTTARMSVEYRRLYGRLLSHAAPDAPPIPRIGLVLKGRRSRPATAYIRLLQPLAVEIDGRFMDVRITTQAWLDAGGVDHVDALVIQRDAVEASQTTHLIDRLASRAIPYAYEVDDKLWAMPEDHWDHGIDPDQQEAIRQLIQRAAVVTTSTEALATELREWNGNVRVVSNDLDPSIWLAPIPSDYAARVIEECELQDDVPRILYMGTRCHGPDLDMVAPAVEEVTRALRHVKVIQIRGGNLLPTARKIPVPDEHAEYPDFVRWFRVLCSRATIAIAPLRATEFNEVKSDIKVLDYALGKVPAIFSAVAPYRAAVSHRETGLLCENDTSAWRDAMVTLLHDEALRTTLRDGAFDRATRRLLGRTGKHPWREVLAELVASRVRADSKR